MVAVANNASTPLRHLNLGQGQRAAPPGIVTAAAAIMCRLLPMLVVAARGVRVAPYRRVRVAPYRRVRVAPYRRVRVAPYRQNRKKTKQLRSAKRPRSTKKLKSVNRPRSAKQLRSGNRPRSTN